MNIQCYHCCIAVNVPKQCGKCHKRVYCSKECQVADWKGGHKDWCCKAGELNHDFEIKDVGDGKGFGVFAKREFFAGEVVLADRCLPFPRDDRFSKDKIMEAMSASQFAAVMDLAPMGEELEKAMVESNCAEPVVIKLSRNGFESDDVDGMRMFAACILGSRFNHACRPSNNCTFDPIGKVNLFKATCSIAAGQEIFVCYMSDNTSNFLGGLKMKYGFDCTCRICQDPVLQGLAKRLMEVEKEVTENYNTQRMTPDERLFAACELYRLVEALQIPYTARTNIYALISVQVGNHLPLYNMLRACAAAHVLKIDHWSSKYSANERASFSMTLEMSRGNTPVDALLSMDILSLFPAFCRTMCEEERQKKLEELIPSVDLSTLKLVRMDAYAVGVIAVKKEQKVKKNVGKGL